MVIEYDMERIHDDLTKVHGVIPKDRAKYVSADKTQTVLSYHGINMHEIPITLLAFLQLNARRVSNYPKRILPYDWNCVQVW